MVDLQKLNSIKKDFKSLFEDEKYRNSLPLIQEIIIKLQSFLPPDDPEYQDYIIDFAQNLNAAGMIALERKKFDVAYRCLKKAESLNAKSPESQSTTYNNLGIYYKKKNKLTTSLLYLQKSLETQLKSQYSSTLPDIYVNLAATLSGLGNHHQALMNVMMGVILQQHQIMTTLLSKLDPQNQIINAQRFNVLALGYHNLAVQLQHLHKKQQAKNCYQKSSDIIKKYNEHNKKLFNFLEKTKQQFKIAQTSSTFMPTIKTKMHLRTQPDSVQKEKSESKLKNIKLKFENDIQKFRTSYNHRRNSHFNIVVRKHTHGLSKNLDICKFTRSTEQKSVDYRNLLDSSRHQ